MNFEDALRTQLDADPSVSRRAKKLREVLDSRPSRRRTRVLERLERHAAAHLGRDVSEVDDWSPNKVGAVDWKKIIDLLIQILPLILALFGL
jgi:hypothetical protein